MEHMHGVYYNVAKRAREIPNQDFFVECRTVYCFVPVALKLLCIESRALSAVQREATGGSPSLAGKCSETRWAGPLDSIKCLTAV